MVSSRITFHKTLLQCSIHRISKYIHHSLKLVDSYIKVYQLRTLTFLILHLKYDVQSQNLLFLVHLIRPIVRFQALSLDVQYFLYTILTFQQQYLSKIWLLKVLIKHHLILEEYYVNHHFYKVLELNKYYVYCGTYLIV